MSNCICNTSSLYDYVIADLKEGHSCVADFVMTYRCTVSTPEYFESSAVRISYDPSRFVRAFTIADVFRLVEWEHGENNRRPIHRIMELKDDGWVELVNCSFTKSAEQKAKEHAVLAEFGMEGLFDE